MPYKSLYRSNRKRPMSKEVNTPDEQEDFCLDCYIRCCGSFAVNILLDEGVKKIDGVFGSGYAARHSELLASYLNVAKDIFIHKDDLPVSV
jgi:hypothetical protein